jgi:DMSO/TMAO reductase YedYZ molybdopterin-dependent catalytic subunit
MADNKPIDRRRLLKGAALTGALGLSACGDDISHSQSVGDILSGAETLTYRVQRLLLGRRGLAREFTEADLSPAFRANGSINPPDADYHALVANGFADWRLRVEGLVEKPISYSLTELRAMPARTQITRHDCVEGWSCIGKWTGVQLSYVLGEAKPQDNARFVVFYCADTLEGAKYYESIDLNDAYHPQTILAYDMNDAPLAVAHGAPLRVRLERMLGYKMAKYIMRIALVADFKSIGGGKGGYWEDQGYAWYGGI